MNWEPIAERMWKGMVIILVIVFCIAMWKLVLGLIVLSPVIYGAGWLFDRIFRSR